MKMKKDGKINYRKCDISYSAYEEDGEYSATAQINIGLGDSNINKSMCLNRRHSTIDSAEKSIIEDCKKWLDNKIDVEK